MALRRSPVVPRDPDPYWCPDFVLAGPCQETWYPEGPPVSAEEWPSYSVTLWRRARNARTAWIEVHGLERGDPRIPLPLQQGGSPWSYRVWLERGLLPGMLARRGLPIDWIPTPAPRILFDLPNYGPIPEAAAALLSGRSGGLETPAPRHG